MPATKTMIHSLDTIPSAPPVTDEITEDGPVQYPSIDVGPVDVSSPSIEQLPGSKSKVKGDKDATSSCVICLDAPAEGACVPCGHMAGCMSCLNEVKAKNGVALFVVPISARLLGCMPFDYQSRIR